MVKLKLKLSEVADDTPVKIVLDLPASLHRDLVRYGELLGESSGRTIEPAKLIVPMLTRFIASDRGWCRRPAAREGRAPD
ncbi:DUF2274 domain-containing protein [Caulobacter sp. KR2-114]|uniref:DUF2274 domain-containing protein n=1 Tax=Caulobacter sp. KR2-114 TaxID=3400912 RepID=UPI003C0651C7